MEEIFDTTDLFDFEKLMLAKPTSMPGGNFFIRFLVNNSHLYIQPPKCKTKQGIIKAGKKSYSDLMFTNENDQFIRWMENLELHCQKYILKNKAEWFEGDLELHDIENYFTSPMKVYKSGKYYTVRTNISTILGKPTLKLYDEDENEVDMEAINDTTDIMTILEIQGIKCSARSFQIEIELKQLMVLKPSNIFEKCLLRPKQSKMESVAITAGLASESLIDENVVSVASESVATESVATESVANEVAIVEEGVATESDEGLATVSSVENEKNTSSLINDQAISDDNIMIDTEDMMKTEEKDPNVMEEVEFNLEELLDSETIQIKKRNEVYYEMYREARRKAKIARALALSSYLEAKQIKNTYMLDDIKDSDDSDVEMDGEEGVEEESLHFENNH